MFTAMNFLFSARLALAALSAVLLLNLLTLTDAVATQPSLYERMGGAAVVGVVAEQLIDRTVSQPNMQHSFDKVDLPRLKRLLAEQLCALSGGPCTYTGDSMREVHAGLNIRQSEFYGMVEILREVMQQNGIALRERNELLTLLAPMKRDVVTR